MLIFFSNAGTSRSTVLQERCVTTGMFRRMGKGSPKIRKGGIPNMLERFFKIKESGSTVRTEIVAGLTTFLTMAYILAVNPGMLSNGNQQIFNGVFIATCISAFVGTILMALLARIPFAQASGMGLNAFFAFTVMPTMATLGGENTTVIEQYQMALAIVLMSGLLFILITVIGLREAIVKAIPKNIKIAISGGIGLFLAYLGLQNAHIIVPSESTQVTLVNFAGLADGTVPVGGGLSPRQMALGAIIAIVGVVLIAALNKLRIKGAILIGIAACTVLCYIPGSVSDLSAFDMPNIGTQFSDFFHVSFFRFDFVTLFGGKDVFASIITALVLMISFSMVDMFDTIGTLLGTAKKANLLDEDGNMPSMKKALLCDAIATTAGACLGTSTVTTYVESSAGIGEGGRTGLTSLTTAVLFLLALVLGPFVGLIPGVATAPALIYVGALMVTGIKDIDFSDITETVPAFLTILMMPLAYSISNGIAFGIISYCLIKLISGRVKETNVITWIIAALFAISFIAPVFL